MTLRPEKMSVSTSWADGLMVSTDRSTNDTRKSCFTSAVPYFANDLLTLTLQLLRDGICYGFLIYRLAHGTMTVSGFVLALGAVSGFSSYFNEITSSLSKSYSVSNSPVDAEIS